MHAALRVCATLNISAMYIFNLNFPSPSDATEPA
jgi:hypothetical protein